MESEITELTEQSVREKGVAVIESEITERTEEKKEKGVAAMQSEIPERTEPEKKKKEKGVAAMESEISERTEKEKEKGVAAMQSEITERTVPEKKVKEKEKGVAAIQSEITERTELEKKVKKEKKKKKKKEKGVAAMESEITEGTEPEKNENKVKKKKKKKKEKGVATMQSEITEHTVSEKKVKKEKKEKVKGLRMTKYGLALSTYPNMTMEDHRALKREMEKFSGRYNHGLRSFTAEESERYHRQVDESDGFDVDFFPKISECGLIYPWNLNDESIKTATEFGKIAVEDYNNQIQKQSGEGKEAMLEFLKPLKINYQLSGGDNYFITFEAKDVGAPDDQSRIYQTFVYDGFVEDEREVVLFRLKPTQIDNSSEKCCACKEDKE